MQITAGTLISLFSFDVGYEILNSRAAVYRAEALETTIIVLIAVEIVLSFLRR